MNPPVTRRGSLKQRLTPSFTNLFKLNNKKRIRDSESEEEEEESKKTSKPVVNNNNSVMVSAAPAKLSAGKNKGTSVPPSGGSERSTRQKRSAEGITENQSKRRHTEFKEMEKKYEEAIPEEYRKYRPKGYRFNLPATDRPIRVYADGVFDLFHLGHMKQLEQCKKSFENVTLICGVPNDKTTHKLKGLTVLTDKQRCESLRHCRWVDEVIEDAPWCVSPEFLEKHNIDYVAHDDIPYVSADSDDIYKPIKEMGKFLATQRTDGISTSDIITKIIRDYDKYLMRNFARGATRQELNVSWLKKNELEFKKHIQDFRSYFKKNQEKLNDASKDLYFEVREMLLKKTLGKNLYSKLVGVGAGAGASPPPKKHRTIRGHSPATEFAHIYTGEGLNISTSSTISDSTISSNSTNTTAISSESEEDTTTVSTHGNDGQASMLPHQKKG